MRCSKFNGAKIRDCSITAMEFESFEEGLAFHCKKVRSAEFLGRKRVAETTFKAARRLWHSRLSIIPASRQAGNIDSRFPPQEWHKFLVFSIQHLICKKELMNQVTTGKMSRMQIQLPILLLQGRRQNRISTKTPT